MTYDLIETSVYEGEPVELFEFARVNTRWLYTSSDEDTLAGGIKYLAYPIERPSLEQSQDMGRNPITVSASQDLPFVQQYISSPPTDSVSLTIKRTHISDTDGQIVVIWVGRVANVKFKGDKVEIRCEPLYTALKRPALRRLYQVSCPHVLYGGPCGVSNASFELETGLLSVDGVQLESLDFASEVDGYFTGGYIIHQVGGVFDKRFILSHVGDQITINLPFRSLAVGGSVLVYPGCDHSTETCKNKFNNLNNYGGQPFIPSKNPFSGNSVF